MPVNPACVLLAWEVRGVRGSGADLVQGPYAYRHLFENAIGYLRKQSQEYV
jgi:hypothetical protein